MLINQRRRKKRPKLTQQKFRKLLTLNKYKLNKEIKKLLKPSVRIHQNMTIKKIRQDNTRLRIALTYQHPKVHRETIFDQRGNAHIQFRVDKYSRLHSFYMTYKKHPWRVKKYNTFEKDLIKHRMKKVSYFMKYRDL